jgi:signal recognition particle receptor subunit beta
MALFNYATRELSAKVVYYGPGLSGKTTNIEMVHRLLRPEQKGRLISLPTETDRTLFFDFLPLDLGQIKGFKVRFHLYTVPGQVFYNATRRLVLQGVDGVVFVADSQVDMMGSNAESLKNLRDNLATYGKKLEEIPFVMQYNKRDLRNIASVPEMNAQLNDRNVRVFEGIAKDGVGVTETLVGISRLVFAYLRKTLMLPGETAEAEELGEITSAIAGGTRMEGVDPLEEISEIEEIAEIQEVRDILEIPAEPEGPGVRDIPDVEEIPETMEIPEGVEMIIPPKEVAESLYDEAPAREEEDRLEKPREEVAPTPVDIPEEIEIEIPERFEESFPPQVAHPGVSVKVEGEELAFLKFEEASISREGHAVLAAVFIDAMGNPVRIRIRISIEEGRE